MTRSAKVLLFFFAVVIVYFLVDRFVVHKIGSDFSIDYNKSSASGLINFQTPYVKLEFDKNHPSYKNLMIDPRGRQNYTENLLRGNGLYLEYETEDYNWMHSFDSNVETTVVADDSNPEYLKAVIYPIRPSPGIIETHTVYVYKNKPQIKFDFRIQTETEGRYRVFGKMQAEIQPENPKRSLYFAGRKGLVLDDGNYISDEIIIDDGTGIAGKLCKDCDSTFVFSNGSSHTALNPFVQNVGHEYARIGLSLWGSFGSGGIYPSGIGNDHTFSVVADFGNEAFTSSLNGPLRRLKETNSGFAQQDQNYIYWLSIIGTTRDFSVLGKNYFMNKTLAVHGSQDIDKVAYQWAWIRDSFHGWHSAVYVAGDYMLDVLKDSIVAFSKLKNQQNLTATNTAPAYGNLDAAAQLILMTYDYYSKTGTYPSGISFSTVSERADSLINYINTKNLFGVKLMFLPQNTTLQTYPDDDSQGVGEQMYLNAIVYDSLNKAGYLAKIDGNIAASNRFLNFAEEMRIQINKENTEELNSGLWNVSLGCFVQKRASGYNDTNLESFGIFWGIESGLIDDKNKIDSCLQKFPVDGFLYKGIVPGSHWLYYGYDSPWIGGIDIIARMRTGDLNNARYVWDLFYKNYRQTRYPFVESDNRWGMNESDAYYNKDSRRGRIWDSWGFINSIYAGHYGITMTPAHVSVYPHPLKDLNGDYVENFRWQNNTYKINYFGNGDYVEKYQVNGNDWYSSVLPPGGGEVKVFMSTTPQTLLVVNSSDTIKVLTASLDQNQQVLSRKLLLSVSGPAGGIETIDVRFPKTFGEVNMENFPLGVTAIYDEVSEILRVRFDMNVAQNYEIFIGPKIVIERQKLMGDIDDDGDVDIFDYNILVSNFGVIGRTIAGDIVENGKVDIFDYNELIANFGKKI